MTEQTGCDEAKRKGKAKAIVDLQIEYQSTESTTSAELPALEEIETWASAALKTQEDQELTVRIVDEDESQLLNAEYRDKNNPTNVLSFPFEAPEFVPISLLGDLVICAPVVEREALEQGKTQKAHWAHMIIHGTLHLQGYDHMSEPEAEEMESIEIQILENLGFDNPYLLEDQ